MRHILTVIAAAAVLGTPVARAEEFTTTVPITQAELADPAAAETIYARVTQAAEAMCRKAIPLYGASAMVVMARTQRATCVKETVARAIAGSRSPTLAEIHAETLASAEKIAPATLASR
jgi:UrcA family protein